VKGKKMTNKPNPILEKSTAFALRIVKMYKFLSEQKREYILSKQTLISGTEIGAYVTTAQEADNRVIFHQDMNTALRKAERTKYWLKLLCDSEYLEEKEFTSLNSDCVELIRLLTAITKTTRNSI
jgi:four helix bundle protein